MIEYQNDYHTYLKIYYLSYLIPFTIINSFKFQTLIKHFICFEAPSRYYR